MTLIEPLSPELFSSGSRYTLLRSLGQGAQGSVYLARDEFQGREVAVKILSGKDAGDWRTLFAREFEILADLSHPRLPDVYDFGTTSRGEVYFTREFVPGCDLFSATRSLSALPLLQVAVEVCRALKPLHDLGLIHGDIKPANLMTTCDVAWNNGLPKVRPIDFSFARSQSEETDARGTLPYMAPEFFKREPVDHRADLYSLGVTFHELLTGTRPFDGESREIIAGHLRTERPSCVPTLLATATLEDRPILEGLAQIAGRLMALQPVERFPDVDELEAALVALMPESIPGDSESRIPARGMIARRRSILTDVLAHTFARLEEPDSEPLIHVVQGAAGTGKGALACAVKWHAQLKNVRVIEADCGNTDARTPIRWLLRQMNDPHDSVEVRTGAASCTGILEKLTEVDATDFHAIGLRVGDLLVRIATSGPLLIICEDVDSAHADTLTCLRALCARIAGAAPVAVLLTADAGFPWRDAIGLGRGVTLPALSAAQIDEMIAEHLGASNPEAALRILDHTGGNPLFVEQVLTELRVSGKGLDQLDRLGPPVRLETWWQERLSSISGDSRRLLSAAVVIGRDASSEELKSVANLAVAEVPTLLEALVRGGWMTLHGDTWRVATPPLRAAILRTIAADETVALHRRALKKEADPDRRAVHLAVTGTIEQVVQECLGRVRRLIDIGAWGSAREILDTVFSRRTIDSSLSEARILMAEVLFHSGELEEARQMLSPLPLTELPERQAFSRVLLARIESASGRLDSARASLEEALKLMDNGPASAPIWRELAELSIRSNECSAAVELVDKGLDTLAPDAPDAASLLCTRAKAVAFSGDHRSALSFCDEAIRISTRINAPDNTGLARDMRAWILSREGRIAESIAELERARDLYKATGNLARLARCLEVLGNHQYWLGNFGAMIAFHEEAMRIAASVASPLQRTGMLNVLGFSLIQVGRFERAALTLKQARSEAERLRAEELRLTAVAYEGDLAARQGRYEDGISCWRESHAGFSGLGRESLVAELELEMAQALLALGGPANMAQAATLVQTATTRPREDSGRQFENGLDLVEGALLLAEGQFETGLAKLDALLVRLDAEGRLELMWQAERYAARALLSRGMNTLARTRLSNAKRLLKTLSDRLPEAHRIAFYQDVRREEIDNLLSQIPPSSTLSTIQVPAVDGLDPEVRALYRVLEFNRRLGVQTNLDVLMSAILDAALELVGAERGFILTPVSGAARQELVVRAVREIKTGDPADPHSRFSRSIAESVFLDGEPVITIDAMDDTRFSEFLSVHEMQIRSVACVPIGYRGQVRGVLYLENRLRRGLFNSRDVRVLTAFADQVAIAILQTSIMIESENRRAALEVATKDLESLLALRTEALTAEQLNNRHLADRLDRMRRRVEGDGDFFGLIGSGTAMQRVFSTVQRIKDMDVPVVILGESGTGKDAVARVIHDNGGRCRGPFMTLSPGAVPETLVESTLFGHTRGAFSGAVGDAPGIFAAAAGGTLYVDGVSEMSHRMQVDLLRVLQEGVFTPLGGNQVVRTDFRLICSSGEPLEALVEQGRLRPDLLYRLQVIRLDLPILSERAEDIPTLARRIAEAECRKLRQPVRALSAEGMTLLMKHSWPGNVRELQQVIRRALIVTEGVGPLTGENLFHNAAMHASAPVRPAVLKRASTDDQAAEIHAALEKCQWNRSQAAELLGIPRRTFYRRLKTMGLL